MSSLSNACNLSNNVFSAITEGIAPCKYFSTSNFSSLKLSSKDIFILHLNIRSLNKNYDDLYELISEFPHPPDLVCFSETKLKNNTHVNIQISGYQFVHADSAYNAGGVGIYISDNIEFNNASSYSITVQLMDAKTSGSALTLILPKNILLVSYIAIPSLMLMSLLPNLMNVYKR